MKNDKRRGFTLVELLVVITIIGLLSTIATASYDTARKRARDAKRLADLDTLGKSLEMYAMDHGGFPADASGSGGLLIGKGEAKALNGDTGWAAQPNSAVLVYPVPTNPLGGGVDYAYFSLNGDGTRCTEGPCASFRIDYLLEKDSGGVSAGPQVIMVGGSRPATGEVAQRIVNQLPPGNEWTDAAGAYVEAAQRSIDAGREAVNQPPVQQAAETVGPVAAAITALAAFSNASAIGMAGSAGAAAGTAASSTGTAAAVSGAAGAASALGQFGSIFYLFFTEPLLLLRKRRKYAWGIVYDSQKKLPVDLAIVRLIDDATGRVVQTRVTDRAGRIFFFVPKGTYRLEAVKPGFVFPSRALAGEGQDGNFANLYFGQKFYVPEKGQVVNPSIPLDPTGVDADDRVFLKRFARRGLKNGFALLSFFLNLAAFTARPTYWLGGLLAVNLILYWVFRRLSEPKPPDEWGTIKDEKTGRPISHAVVRLFSTPYNKLVDTRISDRRGRYNFLVGQNVYYITSTRKGYWKTESFPIDLRAAQGPQVISAPVKMRPEGMEAAPEPVKTVKSGG